ncbi:MAG: D-2-hydroxyacid dehydrogenase [Pigmentiphaga sp.]
MHPPKLGIFLSEPSRTQYAGAISAACGRDIAAELIVHRGDTPLGATTLPKIDVAFLSAEMIGQSGDADPDANMNAFFGSLVAAPNLKWLHVYSAGTDKPVYRQLARRGVVITHSSGANAKAVAHTAMAGMLALARDVPLWVRAQDKRHWQTQRREASPADLVGATVVIVGLGPIGREIALLCKAFGMHVLGVRRSAEPISACDVVYAQSDLAGALAQTSWLVLACPLTNETRNLIDAAMLAKLPSNARIINVGRGGVVNESALLRCLVEGTIAGAYSDVFETEPLPADSPLWSAPNFLLSAHSAGSSVGFGGRAATIFIENLKRWIRQGPLVNVAKFDEAGAA